jgi:hypothetical protein
MAKFGEVCKTAQEVIGAETLIRPNTFMEWTVEEIFDNVRDIMVEKLVEIKNEIVSGVGK